MGGLDPSLRLWPVASAPGKQAGSPLLFLPEATTEFPGRWVRAAARRMFNNDCVYWKEEVAFGSAARRQAFDQFTWIAISLLLWLSNLIVLPNHPEGLLNITCPIPSV